MSASVVTCYYRVSSKHTHDKYDEWITNFLPNIPCQLIVFTSPDLVDYIRDKRGIHITSLSRVSRILGFSISNG